MNNDDPNGPNEVKELTDVLHAAGYETCTPIHHSADNPRSKCNSVAQRMIYVSTFALYAPMPRPSSALEPTCTITALEEQRYHARKPTKGFDCSSQMGGDMFQRRIMLQMKYASNFQYGHRKPNPARAAVLLATGRARSIGTGQSAESVIRASAALRDLLRVRDSLQKGQTMERRDNKGRIRSWKMQERMPAFKSKAPRNTSLNSSRCSTRSSPNQPSRFPSEN